MLKVERSGGSFKNLYMQRSNPVREPCNGARSIRRKCSLAIKSRLNAQTKKKGDTMRSPPSHLLPTSNAYSDAPAHCTLQFLAQKAMCKPHTSSVNRLPLPPSSELGVPLRSNVAAVPAVPGGDPDPPPFLSNLDGLVGDEAPGPIGGDDIV